MISDKTVLENAKQREIFPNPMCIRENTQILNGKWKIEITAQDGKKLPYTEINVPYCPESVRSGIGYTDFIASCVYRKKFHAQMRARGERAILHFGAVDYVSLVYVNGIYQGLHTGGYTPFCFDVTDSLKAGENEICLVVTHGKMNNRASGKQSPLRQSFGCFYTRTTGIWQSVWIEYVPENHIDEFFFYPDAKTGELKAKITVYGGGRVEASAFFNKQRVGFARAEINGKSDEKSTLTLVLPLAEKRLWKAGKGNLYDLILRFSANNNGGNSINGSTDEVLSYFAIRDVAYNGYAFMLNGKEVFEKFVLDQGYHPEGIYTQTEEEMQKDIELSLRLGFNGARLHQKVFDPKFLYLCDKAGYLVWGETPNWGIDYTDVKALGQFLAEWEEELRRDFNHPSIVTWCPLNEVWGERDVRFVDTVYAFTKIFDPTRPCVDVSGGQHGRETDVFDFHIYTPISEVRECIKNFEEKDELFVNGLYGKDREKYDYPKGKPVNASEIGGFSFTVASAKSNTENEEGDQSAAWGYGKGETDGDAFVERYRELMETFFAAKKLSGICYTQLYDVEQEQNGLYFYDRSDKFTEQQKDEIAKINAKR